MKFCSPCATNGSQGKQVSQQYIKPVLKYLYYILEDYLVIRKQN